MSADIAWSQLNFSGSRQHLQAVQHRAGLQHRIMVHLFASIAPGLRPNRSRSRLTTSIQRVRGVPPGRFQSNEAGSKSSIAWEGWCGGMRSTCPYLRTRRRAAKEEAGICPARAPHRFIGDEVAPVDAKNRSKSPTVKAVKPEGEGSSERPGLHAVQQHRQDCSIVYAHRDGTRNTGGRRIEDLSWSSSYNAPPHCFWYSAGLEAGRRPAEWICLRSTHAFYGIHLFL